jgi:hypothetical protein
VLVSTIAAFFDALRSVAIGDSLNSWKAVELVGSLVEFFPQSDYARERAKN